MFSVFQKKKIKDFAEKTGAEVNLDTGEVELWQVSWMARDGEYHHDRHRTSKGFLSEELAKEFIKELRKAAAILQNTEDLEIKITKG